MINHLYTNTVARLKHLFFTGFFCLMILPVVYAQSPSFIPAEQVAKDFKALLQRPAVAFNPSFQTIKTDSVVIEKGFIYSEQNEKIPVLICKPAAQGSFPVVICLHGTGDSKDGNDIKKFLYRFASAGIMAVAIDARYHGDRINVAAGIKRPYDEAIIGAWKNKDDKNQAHPFLYDTVYDLWRLTDYLITRKDVLADRIGMTGISMGGIETWMAASADKRIKVAVPIIAVQSFRWSLDNNRWQGRAGTIQAVHTQAAKDLGDSVINKRNVEALWSKVIPGITGEFDCPSMIRLFAPRPLLLLNNEKDANCPLPGAQIAFEAATEAYQSLNASDKLKIYVAPNEPHRLIPDHVNMTVEWFKKWL